MYLPKNTIKNPLTIIAIFAGISEICGSAVLPILPDNIQNLFVWFVMIFPVLLVMLFFSVLILKHHVLYAPSDFKTDEAFSGLIKNVKPLTIKDVIDKKDKDVSDITEDKTSSATASIILNPKVEYFLAEELALKKLESDYGDMFLKQRSFELKGNKYYADGIINSSLQFSVFEVKYFPRLNTPFNGLGKTLKYFEDIWRNLEKSERDLFFYLIIVTPINDEEKEILKNRIDQFLLGKDMIVNIQIYDFNGLKKEFGIS
ncbi:MAG: hypothetical protein WC481_05380 [Candidatus Omnitrophota bacterium]